MKRLLTPIIGFILAFSMTACEKVTYAPPTSKSFIYTVHANAWHKNGNQISHDINLPELSNYYIKQGLVSVAISFDNEKSYDIMPATFDAVAYSINYAVGRITIIGEDPIVDPNVIINPPNSIKVKIVLTETDYIQ